MYKYLAQARNISKRPTPTFSLFRMSSSTAQSAGPVEAKGKQELLAIEEPPADSDGTTQITVGGEGVTLDVMGPMVLNADGTISRVTNWQEMTEYEQATTKRVLVKRNAERRKALLERGVVPGQTVSG